MAQIVTRIAPSPTGYMHIGTARTALFNYLFAKHVGGQFLLRIEDTDQARNTPEAVDALIQGLKWLGLQWDGDVVLQSAQLARHAEVAHQLVEKGAAYYCYCTPDELAQMREQAEAQGLPTNYDRRWRDKTKADAPQGIAPTIRIKAPLNGETVINDVVQGEVKVQNSQLDDFILLRSDGTPTYMLSVVVDDFDMGITHVLRGDDHLNNAFRQLCIIRAMGWPEPIYGHIPLIHGDDGKKLSKRRGAAAIEDYAAMGMLPEAMRNYLARLGWSHGDDEIFDDAQAIAWFDLTHIGASPSQLDMAKLNHVNAHYMRQKDVADLWVWAQPFLPQGLTAAQLARVQKALPLLQARASNLVELAGLAQIFYADIPLAMTDDANAKLQSPEAPQVLEAARQTLPNFALNTADNAHEFIQSLLAQTGLKMGQVGPVLRAAICGTMHAPDLKDVLAALGQAEVATRLG